MSLAGPVCQRCGYEHKAGTNPERCKGCRSYNRDTPESLYRHPTAAHPGHQAVVMQKVSAHFKHHCLQCSHDWTSKMHQPYPSWCPSCGSTEWDQA